MLNRITKRTVQLCARLFICLLLMLQSTLTYASPNNSDLSQLLCSPSDQPISPDTQAALKVLADLIGDTEDPEASKSHCEMCTLSGIALVSPEQVLCEQTLGTLLPVYASFNIGLVHKAQGPPTGSRAPPLSN